MAHFEYLFESTCRKFHKKRLEMFGIACIEDREAAGCNNALGYWGDDRLPAPEETGRVGWAEYFAQPMGHPITLPI